MLHVESCTLGLGVEPVGVLPKLSGVKANRMFWVLQLRLGLVLLVSNCVRIIKEGGHS